MTFARSRIITKTTEILQSTILHKKVPHKKNGKMEALAEHS